MRIANISGRLSILVDRVVYQSPGDEPAGAVDVEEASRGLFSADVQAVYDRWPEFLAWAAKAPLSSARTFDPADLGPPVPAPRQVLAIGLNYRAHADESGFTTPEHPTVFTKFVSCLTGPYGTVVLPAGGETDWEAELVVVIGRSGKDVPEPRAWDYVAGLTVGQDLSERITQRRGPAPQFSLGKSFSNFGPLGPWLVTPDELSNPADLELGCSINGEEVQRGRTKDLVFSVPQLISSLSQVISLLPGDIIFTGTPAGVGFGRTPQRWLQPGDELRTWVEGIGEMRQTFVAG